MKELGQAMKTNSDPPHKLHKCMETAHHWQVN